MEIEKWSQPPQGDFRKYFFDNRKKILKKWDHWFEEVFPVSDGKRFRNECKAGGIPEDSINESWGRSTMNKEEIWAMIQKKKIVIFAFYVLAII